MRFGWSKLPPDLRDAIARYRRDTGATQQELADKLGLHQTTVTRAESRDPKRAGRGYKVLCDFMHQQGYLGGPQRAIKAAQAAWDGSGEHDEALAGLILASQDLRPARGKAGSDGD